MQRDQETFVIVPGKAFPSELPQREVYLGFPSRLDLPVPGHCWLPADSESGIGFCFV